MTKKIIQAKVCFPFAQAYWISNLSVPRLKSNTGHFGKQHAPGVKQTATLNLRILMNKWMDQVKIEEKWKKRCRIN